MKPNTNEFKLTKSLFYGSFALCLSICLLLSMVFAKSIGYTTLQSRMRVNRTAALTLSTSWQKVDFSGTSAYNMNTFPIDNGGNNWIYWDATNKLFIVSTPYDINYLLTFTYQTTTSILLTASQFRMRLTVPNGVSPGVDLHVPFPDGAGYEDLGQVNTATTLNRTHTFGQFGSSALRTNGFYVEVELSTAISLGSSTLDNSALLIQTSSPSN